MASSFLPAGEPLRPLLHLKSLRMSEETFYDIAASEGHPPLIDSAILPALRHLATDFLNGFNDMDETPMWNSLVNQLEHVEYIAPSPLWMIATQLPDFTALKSIRIELGDTDEDNETYDVFTESLSRLLNLGVLQEFHLHDMGSYERVAQAQKVTNVIKKSKSTSLKVFSLMMDDHEDSVSEWEDFKAVAKAIFESKKIEIVRYDDNKRWERDDLAWRG